MKSITQRELRNGSAAVMDAVEQGETFQITRNGVAVAELRPLPDDAFTPIDTLKQAFTGLPTGGYDQMRADSDEFFGSEGRIDE